MIRHSKEHRRAACEFKQAYATREIAEEIADRMRVKWKLDDSVILAAYRCEFCDKFHIGRRRYRF